MKIMKIVKFKRENYENLEIPLDNNVNHENHIIPIREIIKSRKTCNSIGE